MRRRRSHVAALAVWAAAALAFWGQTALGQNYGEDCEMTDKGVIECTRTRRIPGSGAGVEAEISVGDGSTTTEYGRGMLMTFRTANCADNPTCRTSVESELTAMGCEGFTYYPSIQAMGAVCYSPAGSTLQAKRNFMSALLNLRATASPFSSASLDSVVSIDPGRDNDPTWSNAGWNRGSWWGRNRRTRTPRTRPPRSGGNNGPAAPAPSPTPLLEPPSPFVYNWGNDRSNQIVGMDQNRLQCKSGGTDVDIFILDTGCRPDHDEFMGRATTESVTMDNGSKPYGSGRDGHGHGTHCAGTAAGINVGVARDATVRCVKVLSDSGSGQLSHVVAGLNYVGRWKQANPNRMVVVSLSLGAGFTQTINNAVDTLTRLGIPAVVAAGNSNVDASQTSPASSVGAITVGASGKTDQKESFSNWGQVVDIYAPGGGIYSATPDSRSSYTYMSGTSMATPMVAGGVACVLAGAPGRSCTNAALIAKLSNPRVVIEQGGALQKRARPDRPLFYLPPDANVQCP
ncbi:serine protease [Nannochloropsis oceanica]